MTTQDHPKRQACRTASFVVLVSLVYVVVIALNVEFMNVNMIYDYTADTLELVVGACDIDIVSGSERKVQLTGFLKYTTQEPTFKTTDVLKTWNVDNTLACTHQPGLLCRRECLMTVTVPADDPPSMLKIMQDPADTAQRLLVKVQGVSLKSFMMRASGGNWWDKAGPTIGLQMSDTSISGDFRVSLTDGQAWIEESSFGGVVDVRARGSVTVKGVQNTGPISLVWRQPNNFICSSASEGQLVLPDPDGAFGLCSGQFYKAALQDYYDTSKDFFLDRQEFGTQLSALHYCCGSSCPHASWCDGLLYQIFPFGEAADGSESSYAGRAEILTASAVWKNLQAQNLSGMVPNCFRKAILQAPVDRNRTLKGWPAFEPATNPPIASDAVTFSSCFRNSDCSTGYCDSTKSLCAYDPTMTYTPDYGAWGPCDAVCDGGQQVREVVCLGSDGLTYPSSRCPTVSLPVQVQACNTRSCTKPAAATGVSLSADVDLRADFVSVKASLPLPAGATSVQARLGSTSGAILEAVVGESASEDCDSSGVCQISIEAYVPAYVDKIVVMGKNADGLGLPGDVAIADRIGEVGVDSSSPTPKTFTLASEAGAVHFHIKSSSHEAAATWAPADRLTGIRMYGPDAKMLMSTIGPSMGDPQSTGHGFVVIDTIPSSGIPATRWIYTTRPVWAVVDPSMLTILSGGILTPEIHSFRVAFVDVSCDPSAESSIPEKPTGSDFHRADVQERLAQMYKQVQKSLRSDGWAAAQELRGSLYLVDPDHKPKPEHSELWTFHEKAGDENNEIEMIMRKPASLDYIMESAVVLSFAVGGIFSIFLTVLLYRSAGQALEVVAAQQKADRALLLSKLGIKGEEAEEKVPRKGNPFRQPLVLVNILAMDPIRRRLFNSLRRFCTERTSVVKREVDAQSHDARVVPVDTSSTGGSAVSLGGPRPFVYMREFRTAYELYCIENGLDAISNRTEIARHLIDWFDVRTQRDVVRRMKGTRWKAAPPKEAKQEKLDVTASEGDVDTGGRTIHVGTSKDDNADGNDDNILHQFCDENIEVTMDARKHWLDVADRRLPTGEMHPGIRDRYLDYCLAHKVDPGPAALLDPLSDTGQASGLLAWATAQDVQFQEVQIFKILGLQLHEQQQLSFGWKVFVADFIQVLFHLSVLLCPAVALSWAVMQSQMIFARTLAIQNEPIQTMDVLGTWTPYIGINPASRTATLPCALVMGFEFIYCCLSILRVLLHYVAKGSKVKSMYDLCFAVILLVNIVIFFAWIGVLGCWVLLATILDPTRFLPYGTGVLVVGVVVATLWNESQAAAEAFRKKISVVVEGQFQGYFQEIAQATEEKLQNDAVKSLNLRKRSSTTVKPQRVDDSDSAFKAFKEAKKSRILGPSEIFDLIDKDGSGEIEMSEFQDIFAGMRKPMSESMIQKLFAFCDADGTGRIKQEEFQEGWTYLINAVVENSIREQGLSTADIILSVILACCMLGCLLAFIFLAMQGWYNETSLQSIVQAGMVSGSGKLVTMVKKRAPAQEDQDVDSLVSQIGGSEDGDGADGGG